MKKYNRNNNSPILITGMHRSGTSIVAKIMQTLGVDIGWHLDSNNESKERVKMSENIICGIGGTWDSPGRLEYLQSNNCMDDFLMKQIEYFSSKAWRMFCHPLFTLGIKQYWGWKDPRLCITLKYWKKYLKNPMLIYIERDKVDVKKSLISRSQKLEYVRALYPNRRRSYYHFIRENNIEELIEVYKNSFIKNSKELKSINLKYEELVDNPKNIVDQLAKYINIFDEEKIKTAVSLVRKK